MEKNSDDPTILSKGQKDFIFPAYYRRIYKYSVTCECKYTLPLSFNLSASTFDASLQDNILIIHPGAMTDGPSGPTYDTSNSLGPAFCHDFMYQILQDNVLFTAKNRKIADQCFYKMLRSNGMGRTRSLLWYLGVRLGGWFW